MMMMMMMKMAQRSMIVMRVLNSGSNIQGNNLVFIKAISFLYFHQQYDTVAARFDELCYICIIVNFISQKTALLGIYTKLSERTVFPTLFPLLCHISSTLRSIIIIDIKKRSAPWNCGQRWSLEPQKQFMRLQTDGFCIIIVYRLILCKVGWAGTNPSSRRVGYTLDSWPHTVDGLTTIHTHIYT